MNISELYSQTAQLGFEDSLEDDDRFYYATNRAILQVCKVRPVISRYTINHRPLENCISAASFDPVDVTGELIYTAENVKSYYFEADGNGVLYIEMLNPSTQTWDVIGTVALVSSGVFVPYRGFIKEGGEFVSGQVRLRFLGEYFYSVKCVAMYRYLLSADEEDIPAYEPFTRYDIRALVTDFLALCCPPIKDDENGKVLNQDYELEGDSTILLPFSKRGVYKVLYEHRPTAISYEGEPASDETEIDLDEELCSLLPVLVAAYVWIDDEPTKSEYYMNLYRERVQLIEQHARQNSPVQIRNINGW